VTEQEANLLIQACAQLWPTVPMQAQYGPQMIRMWAVVLADVSLAEAEVVLASCARQGDRFPPAPGVIARGALDARARVQGRTVPDVDEAWAEVSAAVRRRGWYQGEGTWSHDAVAQIVRAVSWDELCHGDEMVVRAHFIRLYPAVAARAVAAQQLGETMTALTGVVRPVELPPA
jgi:hypothetical protein